MKALMTLQSIPYIFVPFGTVWIQLFFSSCFFIVFFRRMLMETSSNKIGTPCNSWGFTKKLGGTKLKWGD